MFRQCVEPTLSVVLELILKNPSSSTEVHQCLGKCMGALITSIGPELQGSNVLVAICVIASGNRPIIIIIIIITNLFTVGKKT